VYAHGAAPQALFPAGPALGVLGLLLLAVGLVLIVAERLAD
jgi:hypothetical protein